MDTIEQMLSKLFATFPNSVKMDKIYYKVLNKLNKRYDYFLDQGMSLRLAAITVVEEFEQQGGLKEKLEIKYLSLTRTMQDEKSEVKVDDVKVIDKPFALDFIKVRQRLSFLNYFANIMLLTGIMFLGIFGFLKDPKFLISGINITNLTLGIILASIMFLITIILYLFLVFQYKDVDNEVYSKTFKLSDDAKAIVEEKYNLLERYYSHSIAIISLIMSSVIFIASYKNPVLVLAGISIFILMGSLLIYINGYKKSLEMLLDKYCYYGNEDRVISQQKRLVILSVPSILVFMIAALFIGKSVSIFAYTGLISAIIYYIIINLYIGFRKLNRYNNYDAELEEQK